MNSGLRLLSLSRPAIFVVILSYYLLHTRDQMALLALFSVSAAFFVASSAIVVGWIPSSHAWRTAVLWVETFLVTVLNVVSVTLTDGGPMMVLFAPLLTSYYLTFEPPAARRAALAALAAWALTSLPEWLRSPDGFLGAGINGALLLFAGSMGKLLRSLGDEKDLSMLLLKQVEESRLNFQRAHRQLQESAARQQQLAVLEERQRLAREIHDSVAHSLTALVVQIQAGRRLLERSPAEAAETIARCEAVAREALQEMRQAVRALHPSGLEQQREVEALRRLGQDFGIATGIDVQVTADEAALGLPANPIRLEQLYRIFQEALTNAHRHGQAHRVDALLTVAEGRLRLTVGNDGEPPVSMSPGIGLKSMLERAGALGGTVRFEPRERGLTIHVEVPVSQEAVR